MSPMDQFLSQQGELFKKTNNHNNMLADIDDKSETLTTAIST